MSDSERDLEREFVERVAPILWASPLVLGKGESRADHAVANALELWEAIERAFTGEVTK